MTTRLNAFVETHPTGWSHDEWLALLADLDQGGTDVSNPDEIGMELERTRVIWELQRRGVQGLGQKRIDAIAKRFGTVWELQNASLEAMERVPGMTRALAEKVLSVPNGLSGHS